MKGIQMTELPHNITIGEKYGPAMEITDANEAKAYFEKCVRHCMTHGATREKAELIERENLGYYAGYYSNGTRRQVEKLFGCEHPYFGKIAEQGPPSPEVAFAMGKAIGMGKAKDTR